MSSSRSWLEVRNTFKPAGMIPVLNFVQVKCILCTFVLDTYSWWSSSKLHHIFSAHKEVGTSPCILALPPVRMCHFPTKTSSQNSLASLCELDQKRSCTYSCRHLVLFWARSLHGVIPGVILILRRSYLHLGLLHTFHSMQRPWTVSTSNLNLWSKECVETSVAECIRAPMDMVTPLLPNAYVHTWIWCWMHARQVWPRPVSYYFCSGPVRLHAKRTIMIHWSNSPTPTDLQGDFWKQSWSSYLLLCHSCSD